MAQRQKSENLGEMLLREGLIQHSELEEARRRSEMSDKTLVQALVDMGVISESVKMQFMKKKYGYEFFSLTDKNIDPLALTYIPRDYARKYRVVPVEVKDRRLVVAMEDPSDLTMLDHIKTLVGMPIMPVIASGSDIDQVLTQYPESEKAEEIVFGKKPSLLYRMVRYSAFPIFGFLPLLIFIILLRFSDKFRDQVTEISQAGSSFSFDVFLYTLLGWGLWIIIIWEINGLLFGTEKPTPQEEGAPPEEL